VFSGGGSTPGLITTHGPPRPAGRGRPGGGSPGGLASPRPGTGPHHRDHRGGAYRAVLGECDVRLHYAGPSGVFKTELAALTMQYFGSGFDSRPLPGNWSSTANATEGLAFAAKDMVLVIDDFSPGGSAADVARLHKDADRRF